MNSQAMCKSSEGWRVTERMVNRAPRTAFVTFFKRKSLSSCYTNRKHLSYVRAILPAIRKRIPTGLFMCLINGEEKEASFMMKNALPIYWKVPPWKL